MIECPAKTYSDNFVEDKSVLTARWDKVATGIWKSMKSRFSKQTALEDLEMGPEYDFQTHLPIERCDQVKPNNILNKAQKSC